MTCGPRAGVVAAGRPPPRSTRAAAWLARPRPPGGPAPSAGRGGLALAWGPARRPRAPLREVAFALGLCAAVRRGGAARRGAAARPAAGRGREGAFGGFGSSPPLELLKSAYAELGLELGASAGEVKKAFRRQARRFHPDLCSPEESESASARFLSAKEAYDFIAGCGSADSGFARSTATGSIMSGFAQNMASGQGHHKNSDGRLYELWLDLRGDAEAAVNARQTVVSLFWKLRAVVDTLGKSLLMEGTVSGIVIDDPRAAELPGGTASQGEVVGAWDWDWIPLFVADTATGRVRHARTLEEAGWIRPMSSAGFLGAPDGAGSAQASSGGDGEEDVVVSAEGARQAAGAKERYGLVMRSLLLAPDTAAWAVAATFDTGWREAVEVANRPDMI